MLPRTLPLLGLLLLSVSARAEDPLARYDVRPSPQERAHWAFQPIRPIVVPVVRQTSRVRNPIDAFVLQRLEAKGWESAPPVASAALLRRIVLDLTGLPPSLAEQDAFLGDASPDAFERLVDRLLASPAYGERWARHWLDVARYADTNGYERDGTKPGAWRYRDRVIRAFNDDLGFDRFLIEQLAGDELPDADADSVLATGFLRLGPWDDEPADPKADRFDQLDDVVATTSEAFLGLTLACARCHTHKFEPLGMVDYYRLLAVFNPLQRPRAGRTELDRPAVPATRREAALRAESRLAALKREPKTAARESEIHSLQATLATLPRGYFLEERSAKAPVTRILKRGRPESPGPEVEPGVPGVLVERQPEFLKPTEFTTRRRLSLARWMTDRSNPLTARVIVNRVWQWHFGEGLVRTPGDFGLRGEKPTHPELLDWLSGWFMDQGWSLKKLHRLILTSGTYAMSKRSRPDYARLDPEIRLLWRFPYRRLEAEVIRDSILAATGRLDRRMFGPGVKPAIPRAALEGHSDPNTVWKAEPEEHTARRTVYVHVKRSLLVPLIESLDFCDTTRSTSRRLVTTVAPQSLILFNGDLVTSQARHLAEILAKEPSQEKKIERAYRLVLCRPPTEAERSLVAEFLAKRRQRGEEEEAWRQVARVLFNHNEFVYPD